MKRFLLDETKISSGRLFPPEIEGPDFIGFHGTTCYHAAEIESEGFHPFKPLSATVMTVLEKHGNKVCREELKNMRQFLSRQTVNFFAISGLALNHTCQTPGGQGLQKNIGTVTERILASGQVSDESEQGTLKSLLAEMDLVKRALPVVYAVDLQGLTSTDNNFIAYAIRNKGYLSKERIVAKLTGTALFTYSKKLVDNLIEEAKKLHDPRQKPENWIKKLPDAADEGDPKCDAIMQEWRQNKIDTAEAFKQLQAPLLPIETAKYILKEAITAKWKQGETKEEEALAMLQEAGQTKDEVSQTLQDEKDDLDRQPRAMVSFLPKSE